MKHQLFALAIVTALLPSFAMASQDTWTLVIQQGKKQHPSSDAIRLKRAPFNILFTGSKSMGFAVLATTSCGPLERLKTPEQIAGVIRPTNITAEGAPAENTYLILNSSAGMAACPGLIYLYTKIGGNHLDGNRDQTKTKSL